MEWWCSVPVYSICFPLQIHFRPHVNKKCANRLHLVQQKPSDTLLRLREVCVVGKHSIWHQIVRNQTIFFYYFYDLKELFSSMVLSLIATYCTCMICACTEIINDTQVSVFLKRSNFIAILCILLRGYTPIYFWKQLLFFHTFIRSGALLWNLSWHLLS